MRKIFLSIVLLFIIHAAAFSQTYYFTGNGLWSLPANWFNNQVPPNPLPSGGFIYITPAPGDSCVLDVSQTISQGGSLIISAGANFVIAGGVVVNNLSAQPSTAICSQVWMSKNLSVSAYRNGDLIPEVTNNSVWNNLTTGAWCWYNNDSVTYSKYGKLYNWYAVNDPRGLAPQGWRIPDSMDIEAFLRCYGSWAGAGGALKETGTANWQSPNGGATNIFGFTALPAGLRSFGVFQNAGSYDYSWLSQEAAGYPGYGYQTLIAYQDAGLLTITGRKSDGAPVRCVRDTIVSASNFPTLSTVPVSSITITGAVSGGSIISDGGYPVIEKGVVWSALPNPVISDSKTIDGNGAGDYTSNIGFLQGNHTYYVRAYARNQLGVGYGNEISFTTLPVVPPLVATLPVTFFKDTMAYGTGRILDYGGSNLSEIGVVISISPNPTVADIKVRAGGSVIDSFFARCGSLIPNTVYYIKAYAVNSAGLSYGNELSFKTAPVSPGNVIVSNQVWTLKDITVTTYRNGDPIPQVTDAAQWASLTTGAWCWYNNDSATYAPVYGRIYNGYALTDPRGLAPSGWHIPSDAEWETLVGIFGGFAKAGNALKDTSDLYWPSPSYFDTNLSGFTGLPNGMRQTTGSFSILGYYGNWWSSGSTGEGPCVYFLGWLDDGVNYTHSVNKSYGYSVRCVKD